MTGRETVAAALMAQMRDGACEWAKLSEADQEFALGLADAAFASITLVAAERGWHMRPDKLTEKMLKAQYDGPITSWHSTLVAAPEFKLDK